MSFQLPDSTRARILDEVDREQALWLLRTVVGTPSVTGEELFLAGIVAGELLALGFDQVELDEFDDGRANAWGVAAGVGHGDPLLLLGHLDTKPTDAWPERWPGDERADPLSCAIVDGALWGPGSLGKGGLAAALAALWTLARAGLRPRGHLMLASVADAEDGAPGVGLSTGMKALRGRLQARQLPRPGFAVFLEASDLAIYTSQPGVLAAELAVDDHDGAASDARRMDAIRAALERHARELRGRATHPLVGSPSLGVGGGDHPAPLRLVRTLLPGERLDAVARELEAVVESAVEAGSAGVRLSYRGPRDHPLGRRPFEIPAEDAAVARLQCAVRAVRPDRGVARGAPFWSELSFLDDLDIPGCYFAAGDPIHRLGPEEHVDLDDFIDSVRALALFIAAQCGVEDMPPLTGHADDRGR